MRKIERNAHVTLHEMLDVNYGVDGARTLRRMLDEGAKVDERAGGLAETPLHVATRRRRLEAVEILLERGAPIDATKRGGKTAYAHALRRGFTEVAELLRERRADPRLTDADRFALAVAAGRLDEARTILADHPGVARTGNPEEDRLLADLAGRNDPRPIEFLIGCGADLAAPGLDDGTPLHVAAWFGQPANARLLVDAGAPLEVFDAVHQSSPLGWVAHGSRYSGGVKDRQDAYVALAEMLLEAGAKLHYPNEPASDVYLRRLIEDASPRVRQVLESAIERNDF